jgi:cytochrome d ubiquinol oxidase subunit I
LDDFPKESWPDNIELLYYSFHLMITLGTIFIVLMAYAGFQDLRGRLESSRGLLWVLMLAFPFPYIANTLGWMTAELGRQPWLVYGLFRTSQGHSQVVSSGATVFTLIGFVNLYLVLGVLFLFLVGREISRGPDDAREAEEGDELAGPDLPALLAEKAELVLIGREISHGLGDALPAAHGKEPLL